jgi:hypothetical protein
MEYIIFFVVTWLTLLVPGFDNSVPSTEDKLFKIEYSEAVQSISIISDEILDFWGFDVELEQNSEGMFDIKIPKNFPTPVSFTGSWHHNDGKPFMLADGFEISYETVEDPCYFHYKVPVEGKSNVEIGYTVILTGTWQLYSPVEFDQTNPCYSKVFFESRVEPPLKQFNAGIRYPDISCKEGLELAVKKTNGHPVCVKPESVLELVKRGWASIDKVYDLINPQAYLITKNEQTFQIQYTLDGAKLSEIVNDDLTNSIHVLLDNSIGGKLVISIPRDLLDAKIGPSDDVFFILIDRWEYLYGEKSNENERTLTIHFPKGANDIEIIGTSWT